jgi:integrase
VRGGTHHPERFSRPFVTRVEQAQRERPDLPTIRLHDLRHTTATLLLKGGVHPKVVAERLAGTRAR